MYSMLPELLNIFLLFFLVPRYITNEYVTGMREGALSTEKPLYIVALPHYRTDLVVILILI